MGVGSAIAVVVLGLALSALAVGLLIRAAPSLRLVDVPGGRKVHHTVVPLVGGLAIFITLLFCSAALHFAGPMAYCIFALSLVIAIGLWDDVSEISPRIKFAVQIIATAVMIWGADIQLRSVGDLIGVRSIGLWIFAMPMTVFAVVGVVNSVNMLDGSDGLAGSITLVAFGWYAAVSYNQDLIPQFQLALVMCGAIAGFLLFNLRFPWQPRAKVFLGDAGSLMIGFALAWFAIDLTQGEGRTFPPIAALWVLLLPLADCVSLMTRRLAKRKSPFVADRHHIHHYLEARGFTHGQSLAIMVSVSSIFGAVGYIGWRLGVAEKHLFIPFFAGFFAYHWWIQRAWAKLEAAQPLAVKPPAVALIDEDEEATSVV
jgi:UDP-GlcNAc:undecaprenyl-phosphate GlcNAc-1-phosphate transferase